MENARKQVAPKLVGAKPMVGARAFQPCHDALRQRIIGRDHGASSATPTSAATTMPATTSSSGGFLPVTGAPAVDHAYSKSTTKLTMTKVKVMTRMVACTSG